MLRNLDFCAVIVNSNSKSVAGPSSYLPMQMCAVVRLLSPCCHTCAAIALQLSLYRHLTSVPASDKIPFVY